MAKRKTHDEHVAEIAVKNPGVEIIGQIIRVTDKVLTRCRVCGYEWGAIPDNLKHGHGCPKCSGNIKLTHAERVAIISEANPDVEILEEIKSANKKVLCCCKVCGHEWKTKPFVLEMGCGCPECGRIKSDNARRLPHDKQVAAIAKVNPNVEVLGEIINDSTKVLCCCKICRHEWEVRPNTLKKRHGCPRCAKYGFHSHAIGKLYIMVDDLNVPTMMKIGVSVNEDYRSRQVLRSAHKAGVTIPALHVAKTWEGPTDLMRRIEQMMHENYAEWNVRFPAKFDGSTEFFYYTPETAEVFDIIEETYHEIINANQAA